MKKLTAILFSLLIIGSAATAMAAEGDYVVVLNEPELIINDNATRLSDRIYLVSEYMDAVSLTDADNIDRIFADEAIDIPQPEIEERETEYAHLNEVPAYPDGANDKRYSEQWYLPVIKAQSVWRNGFDGKGVKVGIIDSGINLTHVDLLGKTTGSFNVKNPESGVNDSYGHGTMAAGVIAATTNNSYCVSGITDGVELAVIKILENNTTEPSIATLLSGISKAIDLDCDIINMSLGWTTTNTSSSGFLAIRDEVARGVEQGIIFIASSGNYIGDAQEMPTYYPAAFDNVISVASAGRRKTDADSDREDSVDFIESNGSVTTIIIDEPSDFAVYNDKVTCCAPGYRIVSTFVGSQSRTAVSDGTSYAAPMVAAAAVVAKQLDKTVNFARFEEYIKKSVRDIYTEGYDERTGYGMLDLEAFINVVVEDTSGPTPMPTPVPEDVTGFEASVVKKDNTYTVTTVFDEAQSDFEIIAAAFCDGRLVMTKTQPVGAGAIGLPFRFTSDEEIDTVSVFVWDGIYPLSTATVIPFEAEV